MRLQLDRLNGLKCCLTTLGALSELYVLIFIDYSEEWIARRALVLLNTPLIPGLIVAHMLCRDVALLVIKITLGYFTTLFHTRTTKNCTIRLPQKSHSELNFQ